MGDWVGEVGRGVLVAGGCGAGRSQGRAGRKTARGRSYSGGVGGLWQSGFGSCLSLS